MRSVARSLHPRSDRWAARATAVLVALAVCGPMLGRGYTLVHDMVFVPDPQLAGRAWGADGSVPRAVPADAVLALIGRLLPMDLVQQALLVGLFVVAVLGAWRAAPATTILGAAASSLAFGWSAYVGERLLMGHWSLLWGYALLPWLVVHRRSPARTGLLVLLAAVAAPTSGVLAGVLAVALSLNRAATARGRAVVVTSVVAGNLLWIVPGLLARGSYARDQFSAAAFAPSADGPLGRVGSLVTSGGVWNFLAQLPSRDSWAAAAGGAVLVAVSLLGWLGRRPTRPPLAVLVTGLSGLVLAAVLTTASGQDGLTWLLAHAPGAGLLRDGQKWVAWWGLAVALGFGAGLERCVTLLRGGSAVAVLAMGALLPVCLVPDLAWGVGGRLSQVSFDGDFVRAARMLNTDPRPGSAVVLPWHAFRAWPWNDDRTTLDPWARLLERPVVVRDDLELVGGVVPGEDPVAGEVSRLVAAGRVSPGDLAALGAAFVVLDRTTAGQDGVDPGGQVVYDSPDVRIEYVGPAYPPPVVDHRWAMGLLDVVVGLWAVALGLALVVRRRRGSGVRGADTMS